MTRWRRGTAGAVMVLLGAAIYVRVGALPAGLLDLRTAESTEIVDRNGELLYEARAADGSRTSWLTAGDLPQPLVDATLAAEDHRFFRHPGIDPIAVIRAAARNLKHRRVLEGGSTLTQQVAKLLVARAATGRKRSVITKLKEAVIALRLEHHLTKREILALYLNLASYGNQLAGADRASRAYFGHDASQLTPAQAAFLAALPQRPSAYNPYRDARRARSRQERVLVQMALMGRLDPDRFREAMGERLTLLREPATFLAPHFVARVRALTAADARSRRIVTTLDAALQREVAGIIRAARSGLDRHGAHNVAAVVLDNATGEWLAWEGSGDHDDDAEGGQIDGVVRPRQPGSALKPFTYALAFEEGDSPATVLPDVAASYSTAQDGVVYAPRNYDNRFRGPLLARRALAGSENVPAVALASRIGVPNLLRFLRSAGFSTFDKNGAYYGLGVTLGDAEVRLDEIVTAYSAFARGGELLAPTLLRKTSPPAARPFVSARTAFWITDILSDDEARAYAFGRDSRLAFPFPVAAKTGTSQAYHDNWAVGYTHDVTVGVWVGNFDRRPLVGSSGVSGAGPIFHDVMMAAVSRARGVVPTDDFPASAAPERTERRTICALSGQAATPFCPAQIDEWIAMEAVAQPCVWHRRTPKGIVVEWPTEYRTWAAVEHLVDAVVAAPNAPAVPGTVARTAPARVAAAGLRVVNPPEGAVYLIDPTLRREFQTIGLRVTADTRIEWRVDGAPIGSGGPDGAVDWPLTPGRHVISAHDARGRRADAAILVK